MLSRRQFLSRFFVAVPLAPLAATPGLLERCLAWLSKWCQPRRVWHKLMTRRFTKDVDELRTWKMDIRAVLSDNAIKDMMDEDERTYWQYLGIRGST